jgi:hypothetical protein
MTSAIETKKVIKGGSFILEDHEPVMYSLRRSQRRTLNDCANSSRVHRKGDSAAGCGD